MHGNGGATLNVEQISAEVKKIFFKKQAFSQHKKDLFSFFRRFGP
jgi:hypothetical protein